EFYEARWFAPGHRAPNVEAPWRGGRAPFGTDLLFDGGAFVPGLVVGVEVCGDLWSPGPPRPPPGLGGAHGLRHPSARHEIIGKAAYRRQLVVGQSGRCIAGYVYTSCGPHESTTDVVFGGHALIADNGALLAETSRFDRDSNLLVSEIDIERLHVDRL